MTCLLINREITIVYLFRSKAAEVFLVIIFKDGHALVQGICILLLEDLPERSVNLVAFFIITLVILHFVNEEQGQCLDTLLEKLALLVQVGSYSLADLDSLHGNQRAVTINLAFTDRFAVEEDHTVGERVNLRDGIAIVLRQAPGLIIERISEAQFVPFAANASLPLHFQLDACHRRLRL